MGKLKAAPITYNNINFKSKLELMFYKTLTSVGFTPKYEEMKFILWEGIKPTIPFYTKGRDKNLSLNTKKMISITYTPDFTFKYKGILIIIEAKGKENDVFPVKKKLFRGVLEQLNTPCMYFEIFTKTQLLQAIDIIKNV